MHPTRLTYSTASLTSTCPSVSRKTNTQVVHDNLLPAVAEVLGEAVTPKVAEAWSAVYWIMAEVLIEHEKLLYASDGVENGDVFRDAKVIAKNVLTERVTDNVLAGDFTEPQPGQYTSIGVKLADGARQLANTPSSAVTRPSTASRWKPMVRYPTIFARQHIEVGVHHPGHPCRWRACASGF